MNPNAKVYAFEPVNRVYKKLEENIKLNKFNIQAIEKAVSNFNGTATIFDTPTEHIYSVTVNKNLNTENANVIETTIQTITLNSFVKEMNLEKIDLIKIDVETHEAEVLDGFNEYLEKFQPTLLIEILNDEVGLRVSECVKNINYLFFNIDERGGIRRVDSITKSDYYNYLLCSKEIALKLGLV
jgi:FkbM family methyltransferase